MTDHSFHNPRTPDGSGSPVDRTVLELFESQVDRTCDAIAVVCGTEQIDYRALDTRANRLAHHLRSIGVGPEQMVGVCLERSVDMVVAVLGILKSGAAYVPLPSDQNGDRTVSVLAATGLSIVVTQPGLVDSLERLRPGCAVLEADAARCSSQRLGRGAAPENLAYVMHTSGSTGTPKGVAVQHGSLVASTLARTGWYGSAPRGFLLLSPLSFDSSVAGLFWTLTTGGRLIMAPEGFWQQPEDLIQSVGPLGVTHLLCVPSLYNALLDSAPPGALTTIETVVVAGESCSPALISRHYSTIPDTRLVNEYGPTEGTVWATASVLSRERAAGPVPIGSAVGHVTVHLVDNQLRPVRPGEVGEIFVGGTGVARGYLGQPALTSQRFVADPFATEPGRRLYRTGDLARLLPDNSLEFLSRSDRQVKINGMRIEPGEIEAALIRHPAVREAVVLASEATHDSAVRLTAYVATGPNSTVSPAALQAHLAALLPGPSRPSHIIVRPHLPRNANDKVDRAALHALDAALTPAAGVAELSSAERIVTRIWSEVLGLPSDSFGPEQNFFDAGGQSLLLLRVRSQIEREFARPVPVTVLLAHATVRSLARYLSAPMSELEREVTRRPPGRVPVRARRRQER